MATPSLPGIPPNLELSEHQSWVLNIALELEQMGWVSAAHALRRKHFPYLNWDDPKVYACTARGFEALLRLHHGSKPPMSDFAKPSPAPAVHHGPPLTPQVIAPAPRPDQPLAT